MDNAERLTEQFNKIIAGYVEQIKKHERSIEMLNEDLTQQKNIIYQLNDEKVNNLAEINNKASLIYELNESIKVLSFSSVSKDTIIAQLTNELKSIGLKCFFWGLGIGLVLMFFVLYNIL